MTEMIKETNTTLFSCFYLSWEYRTRRVSERWKKQRTWKSFIQSSYLKSLNYSIIVFLFPVLEENVVLDALMGLHTGIIRKNIQLLLFCFYTTFEYHEERVIY